MLGTKSHKFLWTIYLGIVCSSALHYQISLADGITVTILRTKSQEIDVLLTHLKRGLSDIKEVLNFDFGLVSKSEIDWKNVLSFLFVDLATNRLKKMLLKLYTCFIVEIKLGTKPMKL